MLVRQLHVDGGPLLHPVAVHVYRLEDSPGEVLLDGHREFGHKEVQEDGELLPVRVRVGQQGGEEVIGAAECLGLALEVHLAILVQAGFVCRHTGVQHRVEPVPVRSLQILADERLHLLGRVDLAAVERGLEIVQLVRVGLLAQHGGAVVRREGLLDRIGIVLEVEDEAVVLAGMRPVQPRERLHGLDARQRLIHVHRVQQRLVVARLELVRAHKEPERVLDDLLRDVRRGEAVQGCLGHLDAIVLVLAGERHDGPVRALALEQVALDGVIVLDRPGYAAGHDHCPGPAAYLPESRHLLVKVVHHDLGLEPDGVVVALNVAPQLLLGLARVELGVRLDGLHQPVVAVHGGVRPEHVQDEPLLDSLLHGVAVEGEMPDLAVALRERVAEHLQRLVLRGGGEGEVAGVRKELAPLHDAVDAVLEGLLFVRLGPALPEHPGDRGRRAPALAGVRLVNDDCEAPVPVRRPDFVEDERELLHR